MIKKCKWCKKEKEMTGKRMFCDNRCKTNYMNAQRRGKLQKKEMLSEGIKKEKQNTVNTLAGILTKFSSTPDQCLRIQVEIPVERVGFDIIQYLNQKVVIGFIDKIDNETGNQKKDETGRFFND
jgi:hypothetical protein